MRYYLDTSVAVEALLPGGDPAARAWIDRIAVGPGSVFSSTLLHLELSRVLRREAIPIDRVGAVLRRIDQISIDDGILAAAAAIEPHVRSLDAIHLATCALIGTGACLVTHDAGMSAAALALGFAVLDPLAASPDTLDP